MCRRCVRYAQNVRLVNPATLRPMRLLDIPEPLDHLVLYELKFDGFRELPLSMGDHGC